MHRINWEIFTKLNKAWHSRLPEVGGFYVNGLFFGATFHDVYYAVAGWSEPIAIGFNNKNFFELRRFAIAHNAPPHTASRILSIMTKIIKVEMPSIVKLISYQDTEVHRGTIYKASGWKATNKSHAPTWDKHPRPQKKFQSLAPKIRWEKDLVQ